jgi:hypothetical protein
LRSDKGARKMDHRIRKKRTAVDPNKIEASFKKGVLP